MKICQLSVVVVCFSLIALINSAFATGPYAGEIEKLQVTSIGNPYNTAFLALDVADSPCASTNQHDRFTISNEAQLSTVLAAVMVNKTITINGDGNCNSGNVEGISSIQLRP